MPLPAQQLKHAIAGNIWRKDCIFSAVMHLRLRYTLGHGLAGLLHCIQDSPALLTISCQM